MVYTKTEAVIQRGENKRARILTAALEHMADVGWPNFNGHSVAANVGVAVGTIYVYFKTMPDLVNEAIGLLAHMDATAMQSAERDPVTRYTRAVNALINRSTPQRVGTKCSSHPVYRTAITRILDDAILHIRGGKASHERTFLAPAVYGALFAVLDYNPSPSEITQHMVTAMALRMVGVQTKEMAYA